MAAGGAGARGVARDGADVGAAAPPRREHVLSRIERLIATRLAHSRATIPDFTLEADADVTELLAQRAAATVAGDAGPRPSVNDHVLHACAGALALPAHERLRSRFADDRIELRDGVDVGFAVATDRGLMVPVVHGADRLSLAELAQRTRELAQRARSGTIGVREMTGGAFSVSNLGMLGVTRFQAVIDPDHVAILAVGAVRSEVVAVDGAPVVRERISLALSVDHRVADGVGAARFLADVRERLQTPR